MRGTTFAGVLVATIMASSPLAVADTYYTAPEADGPFPCAKADPCPIEFAADQAGDADLVRILPGRYELADTIQIFGDGRFRGVRARPAKLVMESGPAFSVITGAPTISDLVLRSPDQAVLAASSSALLERLRAFGADGTYGTCTPPVAPGLMRDTLCVNNGEGPGITHSVGAGGTYAPDLRLVNVTGIARSTTGTEANGLAASYSTGNPGAVVDVEMIVKNTILRGGGGPVDIEGEVTGPGTETLVIDLARSNYASTFGDGNTFITGAGIANNQTAKPRFVDPGGGDFRQRRKSPTINAGRDDPLLGAFDFEGDSRVFGRRVDIGADEFTGG